MKTMKGLHLLLVLTLFLSSTGVFVPAALAQNAPVNAPVNAHVLMVIDNGNPNTGKQHNVDKDRIEALMKNKVATMLEIERGKMSTVKMTELLSNDRQAKKDNIFNWLKDVNPDPDDIVFVYFSGHGGADKTGAQERYINLEGGKLYRKELVKAIEALPCRLKILITDACSAGPLAPETIPVFASQHDVLRDLFLGHEGFLNLTSTSLGHVAAGDPSMGSYFTAALMDGILPDDRNMVDKNPNDNFVSWEEVFEVATESLDEFFQANLPKFKKRMKERLKKINQKTQTPQALSEFPKRIP